MADSRLAVQCLFAVFPIIVSIVFLTCSGFAEELEYGLDVELSRRVVEIEAGGSVSFTSSLTVLGGEGCVWRFNYTPARVPAGLSVKINPSTGLASSGEAVSSVVTVQAGRGAVPGMYDVGVILKVYGVSGPCTGVSVQQNVEFRVIVQPSSSEPPTTQGPGGDVETPPPTPRPPAWTPPTKAVILFLRCPKSAELGEPFRIAGETRVDAPSPTFFQLRIYVEGFLLEVLTARFTGEVSAPFMSEIYVALRTGTYTFRVELWSFDENIRSWVMQDSKTCSMEFTRIATILSVVQPPSDCLSKVWNNGVELVAELKTARTKEPVVAGTVELRYEGKVVSSSTTNKHGEATLTIPPQTITSSGEVVLEIAFRGSGVFSGHSAEIKLVVNPSYITFVFHPTGYIYHEPVRVNGREYPVDERGIAHIEIDDVNSQISIPSVQQLDADRRLRLMGKNTFAASDFVRGFGDACEAILKFEYVVEYRLVVDGGVAVELLPAGLDYGETGGQIWSWYPEGTLVNVLTRSCVYTADRHSLNLYRLFVEDVKKQLHKDVDVAEKMDEWLWKAASSLKMSETMLETLHDPNLGNVVKSAFKHSIRIVTYVFGAPHDVANQLVAANIDLVIELVDMLLDDWDKFSPELRTVVSDTLCPGEQDQSVVKQKLESVLHGLSKAKSAMHELDFATYDGVVEMSNLIQHAFSKLGTPIIDELAEARRQLETELQHRRSLTQNERLKRFDEVAARERLLSWSLDGQKTFAQPNLLGFASVKVEMNSPHRVEFDYVPQFALAVELPRGWRYVVDKESPTGDNYYDLNTEVTVTMAVFRQINRFEREVLKTISVNGEKTKPAAADFERIRLNISTTTVVEGVAHKQYAFEVYRVLVDEEISEAVFSSWVDEGNISGGWFVEVISPSHVTEYRIFEIFDNISQKVLTSFPDRVDRPYAIQLRYATFHRLEVETLYGEATGEGFYRKGSEAFWKVTPTCVSDPAYLHLVVYRAYNSDGREKMDSPKKVTVSWHPDPVPLLATLTPIVSLLLPCYGWPWWKKKQQRPSPPSSRSAHLTKLAGIWIPPAAYLLFTSYSVVMGTPYNTLAALSIPGVLLAGLTIAKCSLCALFGPRPCINMHEWMFHRMDLDVWPRDAVRTVADDPIVFKASASDVHCLTQKCMRGQTALSVKNILLNARVRYEWEIIQGEGSFVAINDGEEKKKETGEQVIYQPPDIEEPGGEKTVDVVVKAFHDDETKLPEHDSCQLRLRIKIKREIAENGQSTEKDFVFDSSGKVTQVGEFTDPGEVKDEYVYEFQVIEKKCPKPEPLPPERVSECLPDRVWSDETILDGSIAACPQECAVGDYVRLEAVGSDTDKLELRCIPTRETCQNISTETLTLNDFLHYEWSADKGVFPCGSVGRVVVWKAPDEPGTVRISLKVQDTEMQHNDNDKIVWKDVKVCQLGVDLVKPPSAWLPIATAGSLETTATIYVCRENKWDSQRSRKKFLRLKLKKVSREKGVCLNYPFDGNTNPDLFFYKEMMEKDFILLRDRTVSKNCPTEILTANDNPAHQEHFLYAVSRKRQSHATAVIRCEDYGAVGFLEAKASHCRPIPAREKDVQPCDLKECCEGANDIKIPRDENDNDIADVAPQDSGGAAGNTDADSMPTGDGTVGDGLTNYEEYRGFIVGGGTAGKQHIRTNVDHKDVFIHDQNNLGTGFFTQSGLQIHVIRDPNLYNGNNRRIINFNRGRHTGGVQHGIWLRTDNGLGGLYGRACGGPGTPRVIQHVCINRNNCTAPTEHPNQLNTTIAHELGHAVNIRHHGDAGYRHEVNRHADVGSVSSGDVNCVMRYDNWARGWCHSFGGNNDDFHPYPRNVTAHDGVTMVEQPGTSFCNTATGTQSNDAGPGHRNNASRGNCLGQIRVKDW